MRVRYKITHSAYFKSGLLYTYDVIADSLQELEKESSTILKKDRKNDSGLVEISAITKITEEKITEPTQKVFVKNFKHPYIFTKHKS